MQTSSLMMIALMALSIPSYGRVVVHASANIFDRSASSSSSGTIRQKQGGDAQEETFNKRIVQCPGSEPPVLGYNNLQDIVDDQQEELDRIQAGQDPRPPYLFNLCGGAQFNMTSTTDPDAAALPVKLGDVTFTCEYTGCVFSGGKYQVEIMEETSKTVTFQGITFSGFTNASVTAYSSESGGGGSSAKASFENCAWEDFAAAQVIDMGSSSTGDPASGMHIDIIDSFIQNGEGGIFFSNDGGTLLLDNVRFKNIHAITAIATSTGGGTTLKQVLFNNGTLDTFADAHDGATHTVVDTTVSGLTMINDVFQVQGEGTSMTMTNTHIRNNLIQAPSPFTGVRLLDGAKAEVKRSSFAGNTGVSFGFLSRRNSDLELVDVDITGNTGISGALGATAYADVDSQLTLRHVVWDENIAFTAQVFALFAAKVDISSSCFNSGGGDTTIFISEDSVYTDVDNFMSPEMTTTACSVPEAGRLVKENQNSGCYDPQDSSPCDIGCEVFGTSTECVATAAPTATPSINVPSSPPPSTSPIATTVGTAPSASPIDVTLIPLNPEVNKRTVTCSGSSLVGYDRLQDIINDQEEEFEKIQAGQGPQNPYVFPLCPNTQFDTSTTALTVLLDGVTFFCGESGASADGCVFSAGSQQVRLEDSTWEGYTTIAARFHGITFTGFTDASVFAFSRSGARASFVDCIWQQFDTDYVIRLGARDGASANAMQVEITGSSVVQVGDGTNCLFNQGGTLVVDDLKFENIKAKSAIETSLGGDTKLNNVIFNGGELKRFAFAHGGASQTIRSTTVSGLTAVEEIFGVLGEGASMMMENTHMIKNLVQNPSPFSAVKVSEGALATVKQSSFAGNSMVKYGFQSTDSASLELVDVDILNNTGIDGDTTACTFVEKNAQLSLLHVNFDGNFDFSGQVLALNSGTAEVSTSCFNSGGGQAVLFIGESSTYTDIDNFLVDSNMTTSTCTSNKVGGRLAQENPNSGCFDFQDSSPCTLACKPFGTAEECLIPTEAPTSFPSAAPSFSILADEVCTIEEDSGSSSINPIKTFPSLEVPCPAVGETVFASLEFFLLGDDGDGGTTGETSTAVVVSVAASHGGGSDSTNGISMLNNLMSHDDTTVAVERSYNASSCFDSSAFYSELGFATTNLSSSETSSISTAKVSNTGCGGPLNAPNKLCDNINIDNKESNPMTATTAGAGSAVKNTVMIQNNGGCQGNLLLEANVFLQESASTRTVLSVVSCRNGFLQETPCKVEEEQPSIRICPEQNKNLVECFDANKPDGCTSCEPIDLRDQVFQMATGGDYTIGDTTNNQDYCEAVSSNLCSSLDKSSKPKEEEAGSKCSACISSTTCQDQIKDYILCLAKDQCEGGGDGATTIFVPSSCDPATSGASRRSNSIFWGRGLLMMMMVTVLATAALVVPTLD